MYVKMADVELAISYARASQDRTGEELSVSRQHEDHRGVARERGVRIVAELTDNDVSAAGKRRRPGFEAALAMVKRGDATVIIATDMSRLTRGKAQDEARLLELGLQTGLKLWFKRAPDLDLSSAAGRLTASILIAAARHEIEQKSERQRRASIQAAEQGRRVGGRRPFGYESDGTAIREEEAAAVRAAYDAVLSGVPLGRVASDWNRRGLRTPQRSYEHGCGGACAPTVRPRSCPRHRLGEYSEWTAQTLRPLLLNPRYAGLRAHVPQDRREGGGDPRKLRLDSIVGPAAWPSLVSEETWRAAVELITDPERAKPARSERGLLTGLGLCGVCDATVHAGGGPKRGERDPYATYRCSNAYGHVGRAAGPVDWWVSEIVIERLARPDAAALLDDDDRPDAAALRREARALRTRIDGLAKLFADKVLDEMGVRRESARLRADLADVEAQQRDAGRVNVLGPLVAAGQRAGDQNEARAAVREVWEVLDVDRRRAVVDVLMAVRLLPPGRGVRFGRDVPSWERKAAQIKESIEITWMG
jgi:site-specific DNA recombinase